MLRIDGLRKKIGDFTLEASLEVQSNDRVALTGPSGVGKTTLLRLIAGLEQPDRGRIVLNDQDITSLPPEKRCLGFVFQDHALFPALDVLGNAAFGLQARGVARKEREAKALPWLDKLGLRPRAKVDVLSGGEKGRLALARALIFEPAALLLDEPFSALDPATRQDVQTWIVRLHQERPIPTLLVTHDETDLRAVATRRVILESRDSGRTRVLTAAGHLD